MDALFRRKKDDLEAIDIWEVEPAGLCLDDAGGPGVCEEVEVVVVAGRDILSEQRANI
jgi:hypothetical protein